MSIEGVTRELLVRYLDTWTPNALHSKRRTTFAAANPGPGTAEAALRVFAEFADRLRGGRSLTMAVVAEDPPNLDGVLAELGAPPGLSVHPVAGDGVALLPAALKAAGAAGAPLLAYVEAADADDLPLDAVAAGKP